MPAGFAFLLLLAVLAPIAAQSAGPKAMKLTVFGLSVVPTVIVGLSVIGYGMQNACFRAAEGASAYHACEGASDFLGILAGIAAAVFLVALVTGTLLANLILKFERVNTGWVMSPVFNQDDE